MVTELDKTKRALEYITKLAEGIDPISDKPVEDGSVYDNVRLCRCFYFISDILRRVVINGGEVGRPRRVEITDYVFDASEIKNVKPSDEPLTITRFLDHVHSQIGANKGKIPYKTVTSWLAKKGCLEERATPDGLKKAATNAGFEVGLFNKEMQGKYGSYTAVFYDRYAQLYILDNLEEILNGGGGESAEDSTEKESRVAAE